jgi:ribosomal protein S18 acetylase RimI-like enzyme
MVNIRIREATEKDTKDIGVLIELLYDLGRPKPQKDSDVETFRTLVKKHITDSDKKIFVAELDDMKIVGMVSIVFLPRLNQTTLEMYIPDLVIHEKYQSKGIGKKLMNSCISLAKKKKCHRIRLESGHQRKDSHQFYKHLGFEQPALFFAKNLD